MTKSGLIFKNSKVLVAEDDASLREVIGQVLLDAGAHVEVAPNGREAMKILDLNPDTFDMVLSDAKMPEMDGIALLNYVKTTQPEIKFLIFTGFSEMLEAKTATELGADGFLAKPFRSAELKAALLQILNSAGSLFAD